jgi:superfamily I DNA/RNA helicase
MEQHQELEGYLRYLGRLSIYTRTRLDYEQSISQLTPEQEQVVSAVNPRKDCLIKGGAGTGKSLVLIECLRRALLQEELDFGWGERVVLVTFTRTLAKYDHYLVELKGLEIPLEVISTADGLFYTKLKSLEPDMCYDFGLLEAYFTAERAPEFLSPEELASEVENFLFAGGLSEEEYLQERVPRTGMRRRLSACQRQEVWAIRQAFVEHMEAARAYTKHYGQLKLHAYLRSRPEDRGMLDIGTLFLDEVQDLTPVALAVLRALTRGAMVVAGDVGQSIYNYQWPFSCADIRLRGATPVLKTNFRNTIQVYSLAESFRRRSGGTGQDEAAKPFAFREGSVPEFYVAREEGELRRLMREKVGIFLEELGYDPENLCILVPRNRDLAAVAEALEPVGLEAVDITAEEFSFRKERRIRISTPHSSKGLDFPVVLLYLPYLHRRRQYDEGQTEKLLRNLVYVGITRAMDNVNVFTLESEDPVLNDLAASFKD